MVKRAWLAYVAFGMVACTAYFLLPPVAGSGPLFNVIGLSSVAAILLGVKRHRPAARASWLLFAGGLLLFVAGDVIAYNYQSFFDRRLPFTWAVDFLYLSVYPALIAGVLILIRRRTSGRDHGSTIDALVITVAAALLAWVYLIAPYVHDSGTTALEKVVSMGHPFMDILLLAATARFAVGVGRRAPAFYLFGAGMLTLLATDSLYCWIQLHGHEDVTGGWLRAGWLVFYLLCGAAALHPSMRTLGEPAPDEEPRMSRRRLVVMACASLTAPPVQAMQALHGRGLEVPVVVGGSMALFLLTVVRMAGLVRRHEEAESRERVLREAGAAFVGASSRDAVHRAATEALCALVGDPRSVIRLFDAPPEAGRFHVDGPAGLAATTVTGQDLDLAVFPGATRATLEDGRSDELVRPDQAVCEALAIPIGAPAVLLVPLFLRGELGGMFVAVERSPAARAVRAGVETLASKTALALESVRLQEDLFRREAWFRSLVQNASDVVTLIDADTTIRYQSPSVHRLLGHQPDEMLGMRLIDLVHAEDAPRFLGVLSQLTARPGTRPEPVECRWRRSDGTWLYVETLPTDLSADPNVGGIVLNTRDISERKAFEDQLSHQAFHDSVTGLANRALFRDRVEHALQRQQRDDRPVTVLFLDADDFKTINDSLGHNAGDRVLAEVADRLKGCLRSSDTAARLGGDEFGVLLEDANYEQAAAVATRIFNSLKAPFVLDGREVFVRVSVGIAIGDLDRAGGRGADELLRNADVAMYMAKEKGKNRYQVFEPSMHTIVLERLELKADLQRAIEAGEFEVYYQPIVALSTGVIIGIEALLRWNHPTRGTMLPIDFITLAEETGLIVTMGNWVLREACQQARQMQLRHPMDPPISVSVNLSARQVQNPVLVHEVRSALEDSGLDPAHLVLEITESVMMQDTDISIIRLNQLRGLGLKLAVDDFGTGYSSLNYLRQFPFDILKVDKTFIAEVDRPGEVPALTAAIMELARILELQPVAEGVERVEQLDRLIEMGCEYGQGFLFSKALDVGRLEELFEEACEHAWAIPAVG